MSSPPVTPSFDETQPSWSNLTVTHALVAINVAVFVLMIVSGASPVEPTLSQLIRWGADWGPLTLGSQPWRVLTSNYVHGGITHIAFNMWCLWSLGQLAERLFDRWTYLLVYTLSGIAGSVVSLWWHPMVVGVGASGAIFGLAGAVLAVLYFGHLSISREAVRPILKSLLAFVGYNLLFGLRPGTDNSAHLGGLAGGLFLGFVISRSRNREDVRRNAGFASAALAVVLVGVLMTLQKGHPQLDAKGLDPDAVPKAIAALKANDYDEAIRYLTIFTKQNPELAQGQYLLGTAYLGAHKSNEAVTAFKAALALNPKDGDAETGLATAYSNLGRNDEAQQAFKRAEELKQ